VGPHAGVAVTLRSLLWTPYAGGAMPSDAIDLNVLIVGAGPVVLFLANGCARRGLRWRLIETHARQSVHSKALAIFPLRGRRSYLGPSPTVPMLVAYSVREIFCLQWYGLGWKPVR